MSVVPGRTRVGSSMPLASASGRHMAAERYSANATEASDSPAVSRWERRPACPPEVGFWAPALMGVSSQATVTVARIGSPWGVNIVYFAETDFK